MTPRPFKAPFCIHCMSNKKENESICPACGLKNETYHSPRHHLKPGSILAEKYLIGKSLGEGGFGITYLAKDLFLEEKISIKELFLFQFSEREQQKVTLCQSTEANQEYFEKNKQRFLEEASILSFLSEQSIPGILQFREYFEENGTAYIVTEYLKGKNLRQILEKTGSPFPYKNLLETLRPVFQTLSQMHNAGIYHRDISPDNLMILEDQTVKIIDLGGARSIHHPETIAPLIAVKKGYSPPEQYQENGSIGPWTDIYSLCATIYHCLTGKIPAEPISIPKSPQNDCQNFPQENRPKSPQDSLQKLRQKQRSPSELGIDLPDYIEYALLKGLEPSITSRWKNIDDLFAALYPSSRHGKSIPRKISILLILCLQCLFIKYRKTSEPKELPAIFTERQDTTSNSHLCIPTEQTQSPAKTEENAILPDGQYRILPYEDQEKALTFLPEDSSHPSRLALRKNDPKDDAQIFQIRTTSNGETYFQPLHAANLFLSLDYTTLTIVPVSHIQNASFLLSNQDHDTISIQTPSGWHWILPERLLYEAAEDLSLEVSIDERQPQWSNRTKWICKSADVRMGFRSRREQ